MDDFYIYYEAESDAQLVGVIKAVAPARVKEMGDMEFIRVPAETGLAFTRGVVTLNHWVVKWNPDDGEMQLIQQDILQPTVPKFLEAVPTRQPRSQVVITWNPSEKSFNVKTRRVSITHPNLNMFFFITRLDDPNIIYHHFVVELIDTMTRKGCDIPCDTKLPNKFSVYTKPELDRYQLRTER